MRTLKIFLWMVILTGLVYPLFITALSFLIMPWHAKGKLLFDGKEVRGSVLIGQKFETERYFWGRPSVTDYNPLPASGSNFGPTSQKLQYEVEDNRKKMAGETAQIIPSELLFSSGSGLDPHITPEGAYFQMERISKARNIEKEKLKELIDSSIEKRKMGFLGVPCVNVLLLNRALDGRQ